MPADQHKEHPEMEFLEIYLKKKTRVFFSKLFTVSSTGGFQRKPYYYLVLNILTKNPRNKKTQVYSLLAF
jgi:hypothetical protein